MNGAVLWGEFNDSHDLHVPTIITMEFSSSNDPPIVYNKPVIHIATSVKNGYAGIFEDLNYRYMGTDGKNNSDTTTLLSNINTTSWTVVDIVASTDSFVALTSTGKLFGWGHADEIAYLPTTSDFKAIFQIRDHMLG